MTKLSKKIFNKIEKIKHVFNIGKKYSLFPDYPDDLIILVFLPEIYNNPEIYSKNSLYQNVTNNLLEFLGDKLLKLIHGLIVLQRYSSVGLGLMTEIINKLESNKTFINYMKYGIGQKNIDMCDMLNLNDTKKCADIFEAFIGSLFYYKTIENKYSFNVIEDIIMWIKENTIFENHLDNINDDTFFKNIKRDFEYTKKSPKKTSLKKSIKSFSKKSIKSFSKKS